MFDICQHLLGIYFINICLLLEHDALYLDCGQRGAAQNHGAQKMTTLYTNNINLGAECLGTREQFRKALENIWPDWYRDYCASCEDRDEEVKSLDEYIETSLDESLREADADDIDRLTAAGMRL